MQPKQRVNVTPYGDLVITEDRGTLLGNRGILHDQDGNLTNRRWAHKNWVACMKRFKGTRRTLYSPGNYTELFFLDEATALAAGHRPCGECRRDDFRRFRDAWLRGNPDAGLGENVSMATIDQLMHEERTNRVATSEHLADLPAGVMVALPDRPCDAWLYWQDALLFWTTAGYTERLPTTSLDVVNVLTAPSIVRAIAGGYTPGVNVLTDRVSQ
jgi:hypothetical protein